MKKFEYKFDLCKEVYDKVMEDNILTLKEKRCLSYLVQGLPSTKIAKKLSCAESTVWNRRRDIYRKLNNIPKTKESVKDSLYSIYILVFPNKKYYIGKSENPIKRWNNGLGYSKNKEMFEDIQKYGWDSIEKRILYKNLSEEEAKRKENETIVVYKSYMKEYGYNKRITT